MLLAMKASELLPELSRALGTDSQRELARVLGVTEQTLHRWKRGNQALSARQIANALVKSRTAAVARAQLENIKPIVEFYWLQACRTKRDAKWQIFDPDHGGLYAQGLRDALNGAHGIYVFYDSRGSALYVGQARSQTLWREMNLAFNRKRTVQKITYVPHPSRNQEFRAAHEKLRQPRERRVPLSDLAQYFSAYQVDAGMIDNLEALLVRGFANNVMNVKMERFDQIVPRRQHRKVATKRGRK
jgi:DNA-binding XRE family transcriptional regulator